MIVDYHTLLSRAVATLEDNAVETRRLVYERAWQMLADRFARMSPPPSETELRAEESAFADAVERIEAEIARAQRLDVPSPQPMAPAARDDPRVGAAEAPRRSYRIVFLSALAAVPVIGILGLAYFIAIGGFFTRDRAPPAKSAAAAPPPVVAASNEPIKDPDPGVDGGSSYANLPFYYRRQPVYYRTDHPYHTIVIDKSQHFLYLIQSKTVALRYGLAMGEECSAKRGLHLVAQKREWPAWQPSEPVKRVRSVPANMAGGPGNPLGARALDLDTAADRIHGTNAPSSIGRDMLFGCVRLSNDDIEDLYKRIAVGARVIITN